MTKLLEQAIETARRLTPDEQDEVARAIIALANTGEGEILTLSPEERAAISRSREAAKRGEFAKEEEVRAIWAKHGR
jgi:hypothetical protein